MRNKLNNIFFMLVFSLMMIAPSVSRAATYYVDNGSTSCSNPDTDYTVSTRTCGSGSETVYDTIQGVFTGVDLGAGDIVEVRAGTYRETVTWGSNDDGSAVADVTLRGRSGETVVINGADICGDGVGDDWVDADETNAPANVWKYNLGATTPHLVYIEDSAWTLSSTLADLSAGEWFYCDSTQTNCDTAAEGTDNYLYIYSTTDPDTAYPNQIEAGQRDQTIAIVSRSYITIDNITSIYSNEDSNTDAAISVVIGDNVDISNSIVYEGYKCGILLGRSTNSSITGCSVYNNGRVGIMIRGYSNTICSNITVSNNNVYDNDYHGINSYGQDTTYRNTGITVSGNTCYNNQSGIYMLFTDSSNIYNNLSYNNTLQSSDRYGVGLSRASSNNVYQNICYGNSDMGITVWGGSYCSVTTATVCNVDGDCPGGETCVHNSSSSNNIYRNLVYSNAIDGLRLEGDCATGNLSNNFYYNISYGNTDDGLSIGYLITGSTFYNNTIYGNTDDGIALENADGFTFKNNIISENGGNQLSDDTDNAANATHTNNLYYDTNATDVWVNDYAGAGNDYDGEGANIVTSWEATAVITDPKFVDAANSDFRLKGGSPCIGAAEDLGDTYDDALSPQDIDGFPYSTADQDVYPLISHTWEIGAFVHIGYIKDIARYSNGVAITGTGNEVYVKCYSTSGTGNDIRPLNEAPNGIATSNTTTGEWEVVGLSYNSVFLCTFGFYVNSSHPLAGAKFITAVQ